ncbi:MAG: hypothetical protein DWP97_10055 [Calditrichaeota bacterium]|nr:MAG: hypothetical protein DWP97_10055 [Calditrichota bacterium]
MGRLKLLSMMFLVVLCVCFGTTPAFGDFPWENDTPGGIGGDGDTNDKDTLIYDEDVETMMRAHVVPSGDQLGLNSIFFGMSYQFSTWIYRTTYSSSIERFKKEDMIGARTTKYRGAYSDKKLK